ncbi:fibrosin-1-like protein [Cynoglossus semilaevis]|uniref:fibrosin-1-like protein n=1 Tax=Cynoglossus semilaevis TaxID=244447 RepID=UPI000D62B356|nr:fibrosin-1-like protein [Cynoglossus semilaevis]
MNDIVMVDCSSSSSSSRLTNGLLSPQVSDVGSTKFFSPTAPTGAVTHESPESRTCGAAKFSGLPRSQERSNGEVQFTPPVPSPTPAWVPTGSPAPAAAAAPPGSPLPKFSPLSIKKEERPAHGPTSPPLLRPLPHAQPHPEELVLPSLQHHAQRVISHQGQHHPLQLGSLPLISSSSPVGFTRPPLPQAFQHKPGGPLPSPPALPLSIPGLSTSEYSYLRSPAHRHPAMFATSATLPRPPTLPTNSLVVPGHLGAVPYPGKFTVKNAERDENFLFVAKKRHECDVTLGECCP